jgi:hypothetical protein
LHWKSIHIFVRCYRRRWCRLRQKRLLARKNIHLHGAAILYAAITSMDIEANVGVREIARQRSTPSCIGRFNLFVKIGVSCSPQDGRKVAVERFAASEHHRRTEDSRSDGKENGDAIREPQFLACVCVRWYTRWESDVDRRRSRYGSFVCPITCVSAAKSLDQQHLREIGLPQVRQTH